MTTMVREATAADAPMLAAINLASWDAAYRGMGADAWLDAQTLARRRSWWSERLAGVDSPVLVAVADADADVDVDVDAGVDTDAGADGQPIGYCTLSLPARDADCGAEVAEIPALYVAPTAFRSGAGTALVSRALAIAGAAGHVEMVLWVLAANARARAFYAHHRFVADGAVKWLEEFQAEEIRLRRAV